MKATTFENDINRVSGYEFTMKEEALNEFVTSICPDLEKILKIAGVECEYDDKHKIKFTGSDGTARIIRKFNISWASITTAIFEVMSLRECYLITSILYNYESQLRFKYSNPYIFYDDIRDPSIVLDDIIESVTDIDNAKNSNDVVGNIITKHTFVDLSMYMPIKGDDNAKYFVNVHGLIIKVVEEEKITDRYVVVLIQRDALNNPNYSAKLERIFTSFSEYYHIIDWNDVLATAELEGISYFKSNSFKFDLAKLFTSARQKIELSLEKEKGSNQTD